MQDEYSTRFEALERSIAEVNRKTDDILGALTGNDLGQKGVISRLENLEEYKEQNKLRHAAIAGGSVTAGWILERVINFFHKS